MREHGPRLWQWLQDGAHFYVCGDASRMAKDVDQALKDIATTHGGLDAEEAAAYVRRLLGEAIRPRRPLTGALPCTPGFPDSFGM